MGSMKLAEGKRTSKTKLTKEWKGLCSINKDAHIAISADEGDGKTVLGLQFIEKKYNGNLWKNVVYSKNPKEFYDKYEGMKNAVLFDEALDLLNRINWNNKNLKGLVKTFRGDVRKEKKMTWFYNVQLFRDLHGYWRTHRIRYWLELMPREWFKNVNYAFVMKRQRVPFITGKRDTWLLDTIESDWMKRMRGGAIIGEDYIKMLRKHPFYKGEFKFTDLEAKTYKKYMKHRQEAKDTYEKDEDQEKEEYKLKRLKEKYQKGILIQELSKHIKKVDIAKKLDVKSSSLSNYLADYREIKRKKLLS